MAVVDINAKTAQATAAELNGKGIRSVAVTADITKAKECQRCASFPRSHRLLCMSHYCRSMYETLERHSWPDKLLWAMALPAYHAKMCTEFLTPRLAPSDVCLQLVVSGI